MKIQLDFFSQNSFYFLGNKKIKKKNETFKRLK